MPDHFVQFNATLPSGVTRGKSIKQASHAEPLLRCSRVVAAEKVATMRSALLLSWFKETCKVTPGFPACDRLSHDKVQYAPGLFR